EIERGTISFLDLRFIADDMQLWAAGRINLPLSTIDLQVSGRVPRVGTSVIGGPVGQVSRQLTIQNFMDVVTLHRLENLPPLPVLGEFANDRPNAFSFQVKAPLTSPHEVAQSIEQSFLWLPVLPNASAHPLPSLSLR